MEGLPWLKILGALLFLCWSTLAADIYTSFLSVNTTVEYNNNSGTYDVAPDTSFSIGFTYENVPVLLSYGAIRWSIITPRREYALARDGDILDDVVLVYSPRQLPQSVSSSGTLWITVERASPEFYSPLNNRLTYRCDLLTFNSTSSSNPDTIIHRSSIYISVVEPATIVNITDDQTVISGDTVKLECLTQGIPQPDVVWSRADGKALINTNHGGLEHKGSILLLINIGKAADATYICSASNRVTDSPPVRSVTVTVLHTPMLKVHSLVVYQKLGYHTELQCFVKSANPPPSDSSWYYRSKSDDSAPKVDISSTGSRLSFGNLTEDSLNGMLTSTLIINAVNEDDLQRVYCCRIKNDVGEAESCISVRESVSVVLVNGKEPRKGEIINMSSRLLSQGLLSTTLTSLLLVLVS